MRQLFVFVSATLFFFVLAIPASAQSHGGLSVNPAYKDIILETTQERVEFEINYKNTSSSPLDLEIFSVDFRTTDEKGTIGFIGTESNEYVYGLSSFLTFETNTLHVEPNETKSVKVYADNRLDLSPGGHYVSVIARLVPEGENVSEASTKIAPAVSTLIYLNKKGGERYNLSIKDIDWPQSPVVFSIPATVALTFQNEGNTHLVPFGTIELKDAFGRKVYSGSLNNSSFKVLPSSRRTIPGYLTKLSIVPPFTFINMEVSGSDFGKNTKFLRHETFLYINPVFLLGLVLLFVLTLIHKRKRKLRKNQEAGINH